MKPKLITQFVSTLESAVEKTSYKTEEIPVEDPPEGVDAAVASPLGFVLDHKNPENAAFAVAEAAAVDSPYISEISASGPYVNAKVSQMYLTDTVSTLADESIPNVDNPSDVVVEHTSANPTGPLHIGSARNALIGNAVAAALEYRGNNVTTQYYVNDVGLQVAVLVWAYMKMHDGSYLEASTLLDYYSEANDELDEGTLRDAVQGTVNSGPEAEVAETLSAIEEGEETVRSFLDKVVGVMLDDQLGSLEQLGITVDQTVHESTFIDDGSVQDVLTELDSKDLLEMKNGAQVVQTDSGPLVLTRSTGTSVYAARDIAFHIEKLSNFDNAVTVLGEDHEGHAEQLSEVLNKLGYNSESFNPITHAFVSTPEGSMAKREGTAVYLTDALEDAKETVAQWLDERDETTSDDEAVATNVSKGALAYSLLSKRPSKPVTFDIEKATNVKSNTGPALQYAFTRCHSLLQTVDENGEVQSFTHDAEEDLVSVLAELPTILDEAAEGSPHALASYAFDVVECFNQFYRDCPVSDAEQPVKSHRVAIVEATKFTLSVVFDVLSIPETTEM